MQASILLMISFTFTGCCVASYACKDYTKRTSTCKDLIEVYRQKGQNVCEMKWMKTNCAHSCGLCVPKPKCATRASRYGCCWDKKTEAKGYNGEGCPECKDRLRGYCRRQRHKDKACHAQAKKYCPKSCDVCRPRAPAPVVQDCRYSPYGCCWDYTPAQGPNGEGCTVCRNLYVRVCTLWRRWCEPRALKTVGRRNVEFFKTHCPVTCRRCKEGQKLLRTS